LLKASNLAKDFSATLEGGQGDAGGLAELPRKQPISDLCHRARLTPGVIIGYSGLQDDDLPKLAALLRALPRKG